MPHLLLRSVLLVAMLFGLPLFAAETLEGKVVSVADGDTITLLKDKEQIKIRLHGVDAPEKAQDFGTVARTFTSDACFGKEVSVEVKDTDRYGRKVGIVTLPDGRVLNHELLKAGLAHWYEAYAPNDTTLKALQEEAKSAKRGVWSRSDTVAPWDFRKDQRSKPSAELGDPTPTPRATRPPVAQAPVDSEVYVTETGTMYHRGTCRSLKNSKIAVSKSEALRRGYESCGICKP